jgi:FHA domain/PilZ domain
MVWREQREHVRFNRPFVTEVLNLKSHYTARGVTENVSQGGAFVRTKDWRAFQVNDQMMVTFFLPPTHPSQEPVVGLRGIATVTRIDHQNEGIAVKFGTNFQDFEKISQLETSTTARFRTLADYLSTLATAAGEEAPTSGAKGFFVEKTRQPLDANVAFQLNTGVMSEEDLRVQAKPAPTDILNLRVLEIKKRKLDTAVHTITIGRAPINDIVLYNSTVSKSHAHLHVHPSGQPCYVVDVGSKNGTSVNGRLLKPYEKYQLSDHDEISFGPQMRLVYFAPPAFMTFLKSLKSS